MVTPDEVGERYLAVHHRMFRAVNDEMSGCGLSMARTKVLLRLREQGPVRQSVLAADFGLSPHSITDIVDGLERLGMAARRPDPTDRRALPLRARSPRLTTIAVVSWSSSLSPSSWWS